MKFRFTSILLSALTILVLSSCVTTKKSKKETGWLKKKVHDMNARYNGYFNAKELYKASVDDLTIGHEDNYNQILQIYPYGTDEDRKRVEENMDLAIEKVVKVASLHEPSKWVDDCYVMMGKAQYLKGDYESAQETFEYFVDDFNPTDPNSRVYVSVDRKTSSKEKNKKAAQERKIQKKEREDEQKNKAKERKKAAKERKKAREEAEKARKQRNKDRKKGKKTTPIAKTNPQSEDQESTALTGATASVNDEIPLSPDEQYIKDLEEQQKKAKDEKIKSGYSGGFLKHKPAYFEGMFWLVKTFIAREKWIEANYFLDKLENEPNISKDIQNELPVVRADYFLQQKDYRNAISALNVALETSKDRTLKARMAFILAQAYQMNGQATEAQASFEKVKKYKTNFEMALFAELNQLKNSWAAGNISSEEVIRKLNRQTKQDKNRNHLGGIYSTMAEISLVDGDQASAMEYFKKALESGQNNSIKSEIYHRLANLFFASEEYLKAKLYFDSTLVVMDEKDPRFSETQSIVTSLKDIAKNIDIITVQDSLLRLGSLSQAELDKFAAQKAREEWKKNMKEESTEKGIIQTSTTSFGGNSKFFAYNQANKQKGERDFRKRWGDRPLEDDWRRSKKSSSVFDQEEIIEEEIVVNDIPDNVLDKEMEKILRTIPTSEKAQEETEIKIEKAMFELGTGFRTNINNYAKSNEILLKLLERFPETKNKPEAMYFIHLNFDDLGKSDMSESFKTRLIREFPDSPFAKFLKDPANSNALITDERAIEIYYEETYELFEAGDFDKTSARLAQAKTKYGTDHHMIAKFDLLDALCLGKLKGQGEYVSALRSIILRYDGSEEQTYAREMLRFLKGDAESFSGDVTEEELNQYVIEDKKLHYVLAVVYETDGKGIKEVKTSIEKFNEGSYTSKRLRVTDLVLNKEKKSYVILIRRFTGKDDSMVYYKDVSERLDEFVDTKKHSYDIYAINQKNYRKVIQDHAIGAYRVFFDQKYLGIK